MEKQSETDLFTEQLNWKLMKTFKPTKKVGADFYSTAFPINLYKVLYYGSTAVQIIFLSFWFVWRKHQALLLVMLWDQSWWEEGTLEKAVIKLGRLHARQAADQLHNFSDPRSPAFFFVVVCLFWDYT